MSRPQTCSAGFKPTPEPCPRGNPAVCSGRRHCAGCDARGGTAAASGSLPPPVAVTGPRFCGMGTESELGTVGVSRRAVDAAESARANRRWWDADADDYHAEHGRLPRPRGLRLGAGGVARGAGPAARPGRLTGRPADPRGRRRLGDVLALAGRPGRPPGGAGRLGRHAAPRRRGRGRDRHPRFRWCRPTPSACRSVPARSTWRSAPSAPIPFVADSAAVMAEVARVLRPGGRWVFAVSHPIRWAFPDSPGPDGLTATMSYFDRSPYVEFDAAGEATYVEQHRTLGDRVRELVAGGLHATGPDRTGMAGRAGAGVGSVVAAAGPAAARHRDLRQPTDPLSLLSGRTC